MERLYRLGSLRAKLMIPHHGRDISVLRDLLDLLVHFHLELFHDVSRVLSLVILHFMQTVFDLVDGAPD